MSTNKEYFLLKYPSSVDIRSLNGLQVDFPNSHRFLLSKDGVDQVWEFEALEESVERKQLDKLRILRPTEGKRTYAVDHSRIKRIIKLRRCPDRDIHKLLGK